MALAVIIFVRSGACLTFRFAPVKRNPHPSMSPNFHRRSSMLICPRRGMVCLYATSNSNDFNKTETQRLDTESSKVVFLPDVDPAILFADLFGLAIACQLLGLVDVVNDPSFWKNGGWLQPIPATPSTLPILVQRFSLNSILYIATVLLLGGVGKEAVSSPRSVLRSALRTNFAFVLVRLLVGTMLAGAISSQSGFNANLDVVVDLLRECYFVALATTAGRYVVYGLFYR